MPSASEPTFYGGVPGRSTVAGQNQTKHQAPNPKRNDDSRVLKARAVRYPLTNAPSQTPAANTAVLSPWQPASARVPSSSFDHTFPVSASTSVNPFMAGTISHSFPPLPASVSTVVRTPATPSAAQVLSADQAKVKRVMDILREIDADITLMEAAVSNALNNPAEFHRAAEYVQTRTRLQWDEAQKLLTDPSFPFEGTATPFSNALAPRIANLVRSIAAANSALAPQSAQPLSAPATVPQAAPVSPASVVPVLPVSATVVAPSVPGPSEESFLANFVASAPVLQQLDRSFSPHNFPEFIEVPASNTPERTAIEFGRQKFFDEVMVAAVTRAFAELPNRAKRLFYWELMQATDTTNEVVSKFRTMFMRLFAKYRSGNASSNETLAVQWAIDNLVGLSTTYQNASGERVIERLMALALNTPEGGKIVFTPSYFSTFSEQQWTDLPGTVKNFKHPNPVSASMRA